MGRIIGVAALSLVSKANTLFWVFFFFCCSFFCSRQEQKNKRPHKFTANLVNYSRKTSKRENPHRAQSLKRLCTPADTVKSIPFTIFIVSLLVAKPQTNMDANILVTLDPCPVWLTSGFKLIEFWVKLVQLDLRIWEGA